jgi:hypothetical protein
MRTAEAGRENHGLFNIGEGVGNEARHALKQMLKQTLL